MSQPLTGGTIYSDPVITPPSPHSSGSFGQVLIVLAVIAVVSGGACVVGRIFSRRFGGDKAEKPRKGGGREQQQKKNENGGELGPKEWQKPNFSMRDGDIEFGFENKTKKPSKNGTKSKAKGSSNRKTQVPFPKFDIIDGNMQAKLDRDWSQDGDLASINQDFCENLKVSDEKQEEEDDEFSFMSGGDDLTSPVAAEDAFADGKIKPIFPLFTGQENLPITIIRPPVKKVLVEVEDDRKKTGSDNEDATGPYCEWSSSRSGAAESGGACSKSNSTGFSKIWRLRELVRRCNSEGRDAFVLVGKEGKGKKKTTSFSAHEIYLKRKAAREEDQRRRSYLPYRPELMGFFTNVTGGLSKNVHPF